MFTSQQKKMIALSSLGGAIEFYDFIVFIFLAKTISQLFYPSNNPITSLMATFGVFAIGYLARPIGGMIFGHFGDKLGRKKTFIATVLLMAIPTFLIGCLPVYQQAGIWASCLLLVLRIFQGLSVGGEIPGAIVFITESVNSKHQTLACALIFFGINFGMLAGSFLSTWLNHALTPEELLAWGWRIPFLLGGVLGIISYYLRSQLQETEFFNLMIKQKLNSQIPLKEVITKHQPAVLSTVAIIALQAVIVSIFCLTMPTYLSTFFHYNLAQLLSLNTLNIFIFSVLLIFLGYLADKIGATKIITVGAVGLLLFSYLLFSLFQLHLFWVVVITTIICSAIASCVTSCFAPLLAEAYPTQVRYTGVALSYNLGFAFFGGLTPLITTALIEKTHNVLAPAFYVMAIAVLALTGLFFTRRITNTFTRA